jgi:hypothetical protein
MTDFIWSIFTIDTTNKYSFNELPADAIAVGSTINYLFMTTVDGVIQTCPINQSNLPSNIDPNSVFTINVQNSIVANKIDVYVSFRLSNTQLTHDIMLFSGIPEMSIIRLFYTFGPMNHRYYEAYFEPNTTDTGAPYNVMWRYGLCFLPPEEEIYKLFIPTEQWTDLELTVDTRKINMLYTITRYLPTLNAFINISDTPCIFLNNRIVPSNQKVIILNDNGELISSSIISIWRSLVLLPAISVTYFKYTDRLRVNVDMTDLFNIQLELS